MRAESPDPMEGLMRSEILKNPMVMQEFSSVVSTMMELAKMSTRFADFDVTGKRMYIDQMEANCERYEIFIKRLELSSEPAVKEYLRSTNAQMLNAGFSLPQMFQGLKTSLVQYRALVEEEEKAAVDPTTYANYVKQFKAAWSRTSLGRFDMEYLKEISDPEIVLRAQKDPQFWKCIREISEDADPAVMRKWMDETGPLGPLVAEIWKSMQNKRNQAGAD